MPGIIEVIVLAKKDGLAGQVIGTLLARYEDIKPDLVITYVNPDLEPERTRVLGISKEGEIEIRYQCRTRRIETPSEQTLSNALLQIARADDRWLAYLHGHGERNLKGEANHDLGVFGKHLSDKGFKLQALNIAATGTIPNNTKVLVSAGPRVAVEAFELDEIKR